MAGAGKLIEQGLQIAIRLRYNLAFGARPAERMG